MGHYEGWRYNCTPLEARLFIAVLPPKRTPKSGPTFTGHTSARKQKASQNEEKEELDHEDVVFPPYHYPELQRHGPVLRSSGVYIPSRPHRASAIDFCPLRFARYMTETKESSHSLPLCGTPSLGGLASIMTPPLGVSECLKRPRCEALPALPNCSFGWRPAPRADFGY